MKKRNLVMIGMIVVLFISIPVLYYGLRQMRIGWRTEQSWSGVFGNFPRISLTNPRIAADNSLREAGLPHSLPRLARAPALGTNRDTAQEINGDKFVIGGTFTLQEDEILDGNLFVLGGLATLDEGSLVEGDIVLMGGTVRINGHVEGDVLVFGGLVELGPSAVVENDVSVVAGNLDQEPGAQIYGDIREGIEGPISVSIPGSIRFPFPGRVDFPNISVRVNPFWEGLWLLFRAILWAAVAVLVILFLPKHTQRVGGVAISKPLISGGIGLLTILVAPIILLLMIITLIGIPVALITAFLIFLVCIFGVIAIGTETGKRLEKVLNQDWALAVSAGVGTFLVTLVIEGINKVIPCVGWLGLFIVAIVGIGAVLLTRFGSQDYPSYITTTIVDDEAIESKEENEIPVLPPETAPGSESQDNGVRGASYNSDEEEGSDLAES
jgi:cytoskeletal protein CcmA (bactofilin family)